MASVSSIRSASHDKNTSAIELEIVALTPALRVFARRFLRSNDDIDDLVQVCIWNAHDLHAQALAVIFTDGKSWETFSIIGDFKANFVGGGAH